MQASATFSSSRCADSAILDVSLGDYFIAVVLEQSNNDKIKLVFVVEKKQSCLSELRKCLQPANSLRGEADLENSFRNFSQRMSGDFSSFSS